MQPLSSNAVELSFSHKHNREHAEDYHQCNWQGLARRVSDWREIELVRKALKLAGQPNSVLDLPCGVGRFWPLLMEKANRIVIGADHSANLLTVATTTYPQYCTSKISCLQTSAFSIDLPDCAVDSILCLRLLHHLEDLRHRQLLLREFHRVTRDTLLISLRVDGNYQAWRRNQREERRRALDKPRSVNRFVVGRRQIEAEFATAGFDILGHFDLVPFCQWWRTYALRKR